MWFRSYLASLNIDLLQRGYIAKGRDVAAILLFGFKASIITSMFSVDASFFLHRLPHKGSKTFMNWLLSLCNIYACSIQERSNLLFYRKVERMGTIGAQICKLI